MSESNLATDLFGDVTTLPSGKRGRPAHRWSQMAEDRVTLGLAMGYSDAEIAMGIGISVPTLKKYYFSALKRRQMQRTRFELWRVETLARQANTGNTGALKELGKIMERRDRERAAAELDRIQQDQPLGKKAEQQAAAERALESGDWGNLLTPGVQH